MTETPQNPNRAVDRWRAQVEAHHAQSRAAQGRTGWTDQDRWTGLTSNYVEDPARTNDQILNRILGHLSPGATVMDVGGGAGRYALPIALRGHRVTVVEPSPAMAKTLLRDAALHKIEGISLVQSSLEDAVLNPADVVLCAHVVYGVTEIEPFLRKLTSLAGQAVLLLLYFRSPMARFSPFWERVHGENRAELPAIPEALDVLWEMNIYPDLEMLPSPRVDDARSREEATEMLRQFLYVKTDSERMDRLRQAVSELLTETPEGFVLPQEELRRPGLVLWRTAENANRGS